ncbi:DUF6515 family protein [Chitinophaga sp.]|uniref:DUF6515 family protein n=1 Tax=Chitinophaga sp. TaxID=1869181 RepID=UPI0031DC1C12
MKAKIVLILMIVFGGIAMQASAQRRYRENVTVIKTVPGHSRVIAYQGVNYHYADGRYYRPVYGGYERLATPPAGIAVDYIPRGYRVHVHKGVRYYYSGNVCYREVRPHAYVVAARPW